MGPSRKQMSTSSRVTMTLLNGSMNVQTTKSSLTQIQNQRLCREQEQCQIREQSQRMQELLAEARLEAGDDSLEIMDFGDKTFDSGHPDDLAEPAGGPLLSEFFKTLSY
ncbi:hypothetical protein EDD22DRAFT_1054262 [Suillus occidentalis]|nr:hypothetical protein EDD22DRAFT_1054262 [Suillus occidentalis]